MLTKDLLKKYSFVLHTITSCRSLPYTWNHSTHQLEMGSTSHILTWFFLFLISWSHSSFVSSRLFLTLAASSSSSYVLIQHKAIHILWMCGSQLHAMLQLCLLLQANDILQFCNKLVKESKIISGCPNLTS